MLCVATRAPYIPCILPFGMLFSVILVTIVAKVEIGTSENVVDGPWQKNPRYTNVLYA
jgi:hypothetical protein